MSVKVIIAGAGAAGTKLHLNAYKQIPDVEVIALCDPDLDKARDIAERKGISYCYSSLDDALNTQPADIVSICSPPSSHYKLCKSAINYGCHILIEKPIFQTMEEAREIKQIISRTDCKISAVHNQKYLPSIKQALELMRNGSIGDVLQIHAVRMIDGDNDRLVEPDSWCNDLPGGRWEELIAHPIYKAYQFMGPMRFVHLEMKQVHNRWPWLPADELEIILEGASGYISIKLSANSENYINHMFIYGSKQTLVLNEHAATDIWLDQYRLDDSPSLSKWLSRRLHAWQGPNSKPQVQNSHVELITNFISHIQGVHSEPPVDWQEALHVLELGLRIGREIQQCKSDNH
jgi:predicted dehydrogenase